MCRFVSLADATMIGDDLLGMSMTSEFGATGSSSGGDIVSPALAKSPGASMCQDASSANTVTGSSHVVRFYDAFSNVETGQVHWQCILPPLLPVEVLPLLPRLRPCIALHGACIAVRTCACVCPCFFSIQMCAVVCVCMCVCVCVCVCV